MMFNLSKLQIETDTGVLNKIFVVLKKMYHNLFFSGNWNIMWIVFLISLLFLLKKKISSEVGMILTGILLYFGIYLCGYTFTQHYYWVAETHTVLSRCTLHFFPLAVLSIVLINFQN